MTRLFLMLSLLTMLAGCANSGQAGEEPSALPPQYFYYPRANVYFDSANKDYFFTSSDSGSWQSAKQIPAVVLALMDKSVFLQHPPDPVWKENETHKLVYSSLLYATPNDTVAKKPVVKVVPKVEKPPVDSAAIDSIAAVVKPKKGIGKFFDKIFGRNKKKKAEEAQKRADSASQ